MNLLYMWLLGAIIMFILEAFFPMFYFAVLGISCLIGALSAVFLPVEVQLSIFAISSILVFFIIRPVVIRYLYKQSDLRTNSEALIGKKALVIEDIGPYLNPGRVKLGDETWIALSYEGNKIEKGKSVTIIKVEGIKLFVKEINQ